MSRHNDRKGNPIQQRSLVQSRRGTAIARRPLRSMSFGLVLAMSAGLIANFATLQFAASRPVDAFLVLGGSIQREIHIAGLVAQQPDIPVLISQGSPDPCIWLIFQRAKASPQKVWLENCADSTFGNFYFGLPILQDWGVHKIKLTTSATHLPRALWLAQIILGAHGIWVEPEIVLESGIPANQEFELKTAVDVTRSLVWALVSQVYRPHCSTVKRLSSVDMAIWQPRGFHCEHQGHVN
jgi:uncharacterized SAM-binding protein YcdF (DUF218 family)